MASKKDIKDEINDFLGMWGKDEQMRFARICFDMIHLFDVEDGEDWLQDIVGEEDVRNVRLLRNVYLISKLAESFGSKLVRVNRLHPLLWKRMESAVNAMGIGHQERGKTDD